MYRPRSTGPTMYRPRSMGKAFSRQWGRPSPVNEEGLSQAATDYTEQLSNCRNYWKPIYQCYLSASMLFLRERGVMRSNFGTDFIYGTQLIYVSIRMFTELWYMCLQFLNTQWCMTLFNRSNSYTQSDKYIVRYVKNALYLCVSHSWYGIHFI